MSIHKVKKRGAKPGNSNAIGNDGGRPSKYLPVYAGQARKLCLLGYTDKQLSTFFEVSTDTITDWKKKYIEFSESVREGKDMADAEVVQGLYKRSIGFHFDEVHYERSEKEKGVTGEFKKDTRIKKVVTKYIPPDPGAAMNWLSNRQKQLWRSRPDSDIDFDKLSDDQLDELVNRITKRANYSNEKT